MLWLEESVNWDESSSYILSNFLHVLSLTSSFFNNLHLAADWLSVTSWLETIVLSETLPYFQSTKFLIFFFLDLTTLLNVQSGSPLSLLFHADYQDWIVTLVYHSPELIFAFSDWISLVFHANSMGTNSNAIFDVTQDIPNTKISEFVESFVMLLVYIWVIVLTINTLRLRKVSKILDPYITRLQYYFFSQACETRLQTEAVFESFFLVVLFLTMMIMTFDDDREEIIEFFNLTLFYIFVSVFFFHLGKYSIHYLGFLDTSKKGSNSTLFIVGQFLFDTLNLIGFSLRFFLLMARLNIYDCVDDVLDSYYIVFIDFDEDEYFLESIPDFSAFSYFDTDVQDDRSFLLEDESDLVIDFYTIYTVIWGKYVLYLSFFLEEIFRVGLALFVTYLLIFEINALNRSYSEDSYFLMKRS